MPRRLIHPDDVPVLTNVGIYEWQGGNPPTEWPPALNYIFGVPGERPADRRSRLRRGADRLRALVGRRPAR